MIPFSQKIVSFFSYLIAPPICYACRSFIPQRKILCHACEVTIQVIAPKMVKVTPSYSMPIHAISRYVDPIRPLLLAKHRSDRIMIKGLAELIWKKTVVSHLKVDYIVPIPLHWTRKMKRGFNQAELIGKCLSGYMNVPMEDCVKRLRSTQYQARLSQSLRKGNVKGAFELNDEIDIKGKHILLVDDLCTTGSTAIEVAKLFAKKRCASVSLVVACRAQ